MDSAQVQLCSIGMPVSCLHRLQAQVIAHLKLCRMSACSSNHVMHNDIQCCTAHLISAVYACLQCVHPAMPAVPLPAVHSFCHACSVDFLQCIHSAMLAVLPSCSAFIQPCCSEAFQPAVHSFSHACSASLLALHSFRHDLSSQMRECTTGGPLSFLLKGSSKRHLYGKHTLGVHLSLSLPSPWP